MKKLSLILAALALVLGISQCKKQEEPAASGEKQHIVLNASFGDSNAKIAEDGTGGLKWTDEDGHKDIIKVYNSSETEIGTLECTDAAKGTFEGEITETTGNITFTFGELKYTEQTGELNDAISLTAEAPYDKNGNYDVTMNMPHAVLKLDVSALGSSGELKIKVGETLVASVTDVSTLAAVFVAVPTDGSEKEYKISIGDKTATKTWTLLPNTFYTKSDGEGEGTGDAIVIEPATPTTPKFTVGMDGDKPITVEFAPGNLYWDGSSWQFEANQWDFRTYAGNNSCINGAYSTTGTPSGHWGLFGWSTDASSNNWGMHTKTSTTTGYTDGNFKDWGTASGLPSAGEGKTWRTLSRAEWDYLLGFDPEQYGQTETYGRPGAKAKSAFKDLGGGVSGLVILPDGTENPSGVLGSITSTSDLATYGAVFLPAAGYRDGTGVNNVGSHCLYWSSTPDENYGGSAYLMFFYSGGVYESLNYRSNRYSVRLVR